MTDRLQQKAAELVRKELPQNTKGLTVGEVSRMFPNMTGFAIRALTAGIAMAAPAVDRVVERMRKREEEARDGVVLTATESETLHFWADELEEVLAAALAKGETQHG